MWALTVADTRAKELGELMVRVAALRTAVDSKKRGLALRVRLPVAVWVPERDSSPVALKVVLLALVSTEPRMLPLEKYQYY